MDKFYTSEWWSGVQGTNECDGAAPVSVVQGIETPDIDFSLEKSGSVSGSVTDENGNPVAGLRIYGYSSLCAVNPVETSVTDAKGDYIIYGLKPGQIYVKTCAECNNLNYDDEWWNSGKGAPDCDSAAPVSVAENMITTGVEFVLRRKQAISLTIGDTEQGTINPLNTRYFSLQVEEGKSLLITLTPQAGVNSIVLDGKFMNAINYPGTGDYSTSRIASRGRYEIVISPTKPGIYYFSLYGYDIDNSGGSYSIKADYLDSPYLESVYKLPVFTT